MKIRIAPNHNRTKAALRTVAIPIDHIIAELSAFPFASVESFRIAPIELDPQLENGGPTSRLWRDAERVLAGRTPAVSLDEIDAMRDLVWFCESNGTAIALHQYLKQIAEYYLQPCGIHAVPRLEPPAEPRGPDKIDAEHARSRQAWRWMSFAVPPDLLLAALHANGNHPTSINGLAPQLKQRLQSDGFAESHMHFGAGLGFPLLWVATLRALGTARIDEFSFASPSAELDEGRQLASWLIRAAIARYILAGFLVYRIDRTDLDFEQYLNSVVSDETRKLAGPSSVVKLRQVLIELGQGSFLQHNSPGFNELRELYVMVTSINRVALPTELDRFQFADPIASLFPPLGQTAEATATPEIRFLAEGLKYLEHAYPPGCAGENATTGKSGAVFTRLFWQLIRMRSIYYRHIVQRPMTPGLRWFVQTFGRLWPGRLMSDAVLLESSARTSGMGHGLRALEIRTCTGTNPNSMLEYVDELDQTMQRLRGRNGNANSAPEDCNHPCGLEMGVVIHLTKLRGGGTSEGLGSAHWKDSNADPAAPQNPRRLRFEGAYREHRERVQCLAELLSNYPLSLAIVRGIDLCTDELGVANWVFVPLFRYLHDVSERVSAFLRTEHGHDIPPLRTTVHAGEDFVHLLGGLRRIDEVIHFLHLKEGDRIGHGVALGIDATAWAFSAGRIPVMREERLLDLTWEWMCYSRNNVRVSVERMAVIQREIARLSHLVFGETLAPIEMEFLVHDLHCEHGLRSASFPDAHEDAPSVAESTGDSDELTVAARQARIDRLTRYLTSAEVFRNGRQVEWVSPETEADPLEQLQDALRERIAALGLTIEINPTSNLLIANLADLTHHPLWRLRPPLPDGRPPVSVCVGSDDPATFATRLQSEFMLLHDALVLAGLSYDQASEWIDSVRRTGLDTRFTIPRPRFHPSAARDSIRLLQQVGLTKGVRPVL